MPHSTHAADLRRLIAVATSIMLETDLAAVLDQIVRAAAQSLGLERNSILLLNPADGTLSHAAAMGLPDAYLAALNGVPIGPTMGTCGVVAFTGQTVITPDLLTDPNWEVARAVAAPYGLRAVWSAPLVGRDTRVLGTLAAYDTQPGQPTEAQLELLTLYARLTAMALERHEAEREREQSLSLLRATLESTADGLLVVDATGTITAFNQKFVQMWNLPAEVLETRDNKQGLAAVLGQLVDPQTFLATVYELYAQPEAESHDVLHLADGRVFERYSQPQRLGGQSVGRVWSFRDVTERARLEERLRHQALHDALTGLPNRILMHEQLAEALRFSARQQTSLALCVIDLDRFKEVNDTLGHQAGDALLREVALRLRDTLRTADTVARLGGDEFAVLLPATDAAGSIHVAQMIQSALAQPFSIEGQSLTLVASQGIALAPEHGTDAATLLRRADVAMYVAKRAGGGHAFYDATVDQHSTARLTLEADLRQALADDALVLHYQPIVAMRGGDVAGVEALARWPHPTRGLVPPDEFIPLAERSGLIVPLTRWVLHTALRQCQTWQRAGLALGVSINLSTRTLHDADLAESIAWLLRRYAVDPARVTLEVTESALMVDPPRAQAVLRRLSEMGLRLAIDDFGVGYSSLGYLKHLPVDEVKIDRSFVRGIGAAESKDSAIVRSIIELGHNLGLSVVAEGIEDAATWEQLRAARCDAAQGYYLSRPVPVAEFEDWLTASGRRWRPA